MISSLTAQSIKHVLKSKMPNVLARIGFLKKKLNVTKKSLDVVKFTSKKHDFFLSQSM